MRAFESHLRNLSHSHHPYTTTCIRCNEAVRCYDDVELAQYRVGCGCVPPVAITYEFIQSSDDRSIYVAALFLPGSMQHCYNRALTIGRPQRTQYYRFAICNNDYPSHYQDLQTQVAFQEYTFVFTLQDRIHTFFYRYALSEIRGGGDRASLDYGVLPKSEERDTVPPKKISNRTTRRLVIGE